MGALAGVLALAAALGAGQLATLLGPDYDPPVLSIANTVVRYSPQAVTSWAIELFGTYDKLVLQIGVHVVLVAIGAGLGLLALRRMPLALGGVALLGLLGVLAALDDGSSLWVAVIPSGAAVLVGTAALAWLVSQIPQAEPEPVAPPAAQATTPASQEQRPTRSRRAFLGAAGAVAVLAAAANVVGRTLSTGVRVAAARMNIELPPPARTMDLPVPGAAHPEVEGLPQFITQNAAFYRIDTALTTPRIDPATHEIRVTGMVERQLAIPFSDLLRRDLIEVPMNLICVSNQVGGDLVDAAVWRGVLLRDILDEAGVSEDADQIVGHSVDGYTCGFPVPVAYDRPAMLAIGMNGEPLPGSHGFPVRLVTPGIYGYVGSTKWLSEIQLTRFDEFTQYWASRGYAARAPVKVSSRIEVPRPSATVAAGMIAVAGSAWAMPVGVARVEVRIDDGPWQEAELGAPVNDLTWRQYVYRWQARPGEHELTVRASDANGERQVREPSGVRPDGATGYHTIAVTVTQA
jgi:DMSO/TMAO reductase YedYZ molybdopterin-dependent catalytic subunit